MSNFPSASPLPPMATPTDTPTGSLPVSRSVLFLCASGESTLCADGASPGPSHVRRVVASQCSNHICLVGMGSVAYPCGLTALDSEKTGAWIPQGYSPPLRRKGFAPARPSPCSFRSHGAPFCREISNIRMAHKTLGSSDLSTTMVYTHAVDEELYCSRRRVRPKLRFR